MRTHHAAPVLGPTRVAGSISAGKRVFAAALMPCIIQSTLWGRPCGADEATSGEIMQGIAGAVRSVLAPSIGDSLAEMTVRATAVSLGKTADDLSSADLEHLIARTRTMMAGVATNALIDVACAQIRSLSVSEAC